MSDALLQYGALGLLALVLLGGGKLFASVLVRIGGAIVDEIRLLRGGLEATVARDAALREHVTDTARETRHDVRGALQTTAEQLAQQHADEIERLRLRLTRGSRPDPDSDPPPRRAA